MVALVERSLRTATATRCGAWRNLGSAEVRPGISHRHRSGRRRCVTSLRVMVVAVVVAVVVGSLAALAIAAAHRRRAAARHGADAADRHVGGDDRLRDAHHVRRGSGRLAGRRGGSCRSAMPSSRSRSSSAPCCPVLRGVEVRRLEAAATLGASPLRAWRVDRPAAPAPAARRRRGHRRGDLARRVRGDQLPVAQRSGDDADRHRASARAHRHAAAGPGICPRRDPRRGDDRRRRCVLDLAGSVSRAGGDERSSSSSTSTSPSTGDTSLDGARPHRRRRRDRRPARSVGQRQVDAAAGDRRPGRARIAARCASTAPTSPTCRRTAAASGMVFQDEQLFEHLDVAGNVAFGLRMRGDDQLHVRQQRVAEMLDLVGLAGFERRQRAGSSAAARRSGWRSPARWRRRHACCSSTSR